jgi:hypothetical protein
MDRGTILAVSCVAALSSCATTRISAPSKSTSPVEIRFAKGLLKTVSPGPDWTVRADAVVVGNDGSMTKYHLVFVQPRTESMIGVIVYPTKNASPAMMADRMRDAISAGGAVPGDLSFSADDSSAGFPFTMVAIGAPVGAGKVATKRLSDALSAAVISTWLASSPGDEKAADAVAAGLALAASQE